MNNHHKLTWETYVAAWKAVTPAEKRALFEKCLDSTCEYTDPLIIAKGWKELEAYMLDFHRQVPGGYFITTYFLAHNDKSIARWEMKDANDIKLGDGISYGEYNNTGKLVSMTGFFERPDDQGATE